MRSGSGLFRSRRGHLHVHGYVQDSIYAGVRGMLYLQEVRATTFLVLFALVFFVCVSVLTLFEIFLKNFPPPHLRRRCEGHLS